MVAALLAAMVGVTFVDVIGRQFGRPVSFAFEFTQAAMALMIYAGLPLVTARREHISIDLAVGLLNARWRHRLAALFAIVCLLITLVWARQLWVQADALASMNTVMMYLRWPLAPLVYYMAFMAFLTALVFLWQGLKLLRERPD